MDKLKKEREDKAKDGTDSGKGGCDQMRSLDVHSTLTHPKFERTDERRPTMKGKEKEKER